MEIRTLQTFQVVAEELNLTRAAIRLNYSQPTITKHIKSLEESLGTRLLEKRQGHYVLTCAGSQLYKRTMNILKEVNMIKELSNRSSEHQLIRAQGHDYYCFRYFIPAIRNINRKRPSITYKLSGASNEDTINQLLKNEIDIGIVSGNVASSDLIYEVIDYEQVALCIHSKYYHPSCKLEDYFERHALVVDQSEAYNYHNSFKKTLDPPQIIDLPSDEVVQKAILKHGMLGIVRTGRIQTHIDSGEIAIIKKLSIQEPINVVINKVNSHHESLHDLYLMIHQKNNTENPLAKVQWM